MEPGRPIAQEAGTRASDRRGVPRLQGEGQVKFHTCSLSRCSVRMVISVASTNLAQSYHIFDLPQGSFRHRSYLIGPLPENLL